MEVRQLRVRKLREGPIRERTLALQRDEVLVREDVDRVGIEARDRLRRFARPVRGRAGDHSQRELGEGMAGLARDELAPLRDAEVAVVGRVVRARDEAAGPLFRAARAFRGTAGLQDDERDREEHHLPSFELASAGARSSSTTVRASALRTSLSAFRKSV